MTFRVINNLSEDNNHAATIKKLWNQSDSLLVASPFLMKDFSDFFSELDLSKIKRLHLITTLCPGDYDQIKKVISLNSLINIPQIKSKEIQCRISINNKLHGKVYVFKRKDIPIAAIVSSANFTVSGLSVKHEWGIELTDDKVISELESSLLSSIQLIDLSFESIETMHQSVDEFLRDNPQSEQPKIDLHLLNQLQRPDLFDNSINYWLKPIGNSENHVKEGRVFDDVVDRLHFSKIRPSGVNPGDILIAYGVGTRRILSIFRVIGPPEKIADEQIDEEDWYERWPWYVNGENLTPTFGKQWWIHNLYVGVLRDSFLSENPDGSITAVRGQTFGGLNFGKDKLKLSFEFARFIINQVVTLNEVM